MLDEPLIPSRGADAVARSRSVYRGDGRAYTALRKRGNWNEKLKNLESLDYEVVDNRSFRRTGRHTSVVAKWVTTLLIGTVVGVLAFFMEHTITVLCRFRVFAISTAAAFAARATGCSSEAASCGFLFSNLLGDTQTSFAPTAAALFVAVATASLFAAVASAAVVYTAPAATGAGVSLVMASLNGVHVPELLSRRTIFVKVLGASLAVACGAPVGPEGPLVHVGAGVASLCTRQMRGTKHGGMFDAFHNDADGRDFLSAGVAAGLAAAFGAPVGGVLFSLEEASTHWSHSTTWRSLLCAALAVFVTTVARAAMPKSGAWAGKASATILSLGGSTGVIPMSVEQKRVPSNATDPNSPPLDDVFAYFLWELPLFAMLAAVAAVLGAILTRASSALSPRRPTSPRARVMEAALVAGVCAALAVCAAASLGACLPREDNTERTSHSVDGTDYVHGLACPKGHVNDVATLLLGLRDDIISELLSASSDFTPLAIAASLVVLLTTIPFACDVSFPCGLFMPTIAWGAMLGSLWGTFVRFVVERLAGADVADRVSPGSYAVVGAASALAGMFRSSISLVVIMVEGTGRVGALMPLLLGVAVANLVGPRVHGESFYESQLRTKGVPFLRPRHAHAPKNGSRRFDTGDGARVSSSEDFCVQTTVSSLIAAHPVCFGEKTTVREVTDVLLHTKHNGFPVVSGAGKLVGFVLRSQLMVLLARREFVEIQTNDLPRNGTANEPIEPTADEPVAPTLEQSRVAERRVLANDAAMRTFHHRHEFSDRSVSLSSEAVSRLGLTPLELDKHMYLTDYMKIAPLAVYSQCAAWRAAGYFRASGLRHLPVVDSLNNVVGVLTRRDLVPGFWNRPCADLTVVRPNGASTTLDVTERRARNAWTSWRRAGDAPDVSPDIPTHFFETNTSPDTA